MDLAPQLDRARTRIRIVAQATCQNFEIGFERSRAFLFAHMPSFVIKRLRKPAKGSAVTGPAADPLGDRNFFPSQTIFHSPARNAKVEPGTVGIATGGPRNPGVNQSAVPRAKHDTHTVLQIAPNAGNLRNDNAEPIL